MCPSRDIFSGWNVDPAALGGRLFDRVQHLRHSPSLFEVAIRATVLSDGVQPFVDLDRLELVDAEWDACEGPESAVVSVTRTEFDLLTELIRHAGQVLARDVLLDRIWGYDYLGDSRLVDVAVARLRAKIEVDPASPTLILTVRGVGYKAAR